MSAALERYLGLLSGPGVRPMVAAGLVGRLPLGMTPLALVLLVRGVGDSYSIAGLVVGGYSLAAAIGVPQLARMIDRIGQTRVLAPLAVLYPATAGVLVAVTDARATPSVLVACAALMGATVPPVGACVRTLWGEIVPAVEQRESAYALESSLQEIMFVIGPLLVALIASAVSAEAALLCSGGVGGIGTLWFASTSASRAWRPAHGEAAGRRGALRSPGVLTIVAATAAMGAAFGAIEVVAPAFTEAHGSRAAAGIATGALALGSLVGGLAIGMAGSVRHPAVRFLAALIAFAGALLLPLAAGSTAALAILMLVAGMPIAPAFASAYSLVSEHGVRGSVTESFAWISTAVTVGAAAGTAIAGLVVGQGVAFGFGLSATFAGAGALVVVGRRWSLHRVAPLPG